MKNKGRSNHRFCVKQQETGSDYPEATCSTSCFVAGIVKGLIESEDPYKHFGSLMAFHAHANDALKCGVVEGSVDDLRITKYGQLAYAMWGISEESGRSYMWRRKHFALPNINQSTDDDSSSV